MLLLLWLLCVLIATLAPFDFSAPVDAAARIYGAFRLDPGEQVPLHVGLNVLLFVPLGNLIAHDRRGDTKHLSIAMRAAIVGLAISCCIEILQIFLVDRVPSMFDAAANAFGSLLGLLSYSIGRALWVARTRAHTLTSASDPCIGELQAYE
jgi:glycopeptide antibiotics resistance protein